MPTGPYKLDADRVRYLYEVEGLTTRQIAAKLGVSQSGIHHRLNADGANMRPNVAPMKLDRDAVYRLYVVEGLLINHVAKRLGVSFNVVKHEVERFGFAREPKPKHVDRATLERVYIHECRTQRQVADLLDFSMQRVGSELRRHKIVHRHSPSCRTKGQPRLLKCKLSAKKG